MKILFEGHMYETSLLNNILGERYFTPHNHLYSRINAVGYYFNSKLNDVVFVFPKVFIYDDGKAFGRFIPEDIVDCTADTMANLKAHGKDNVLFELSVWMYQAMNLFNKRKKENTISDQENINTIISNLDETVKTELDIILSLTRFHKENRHLFTQISKFNHSQRNKIHWAKTISRKNPIQTSEIPIYMEVVSKKKNVNFDEELIIIFYSVLNYLNQKYSFKITINENYTLIQKRQFDKLLANGTRLLRRIKYKYYSDKFIQLWNLLYVFFDRAEHIRSGKKVEEVLMTRDFNIVFEDMIDNLIGDHNIPKLLKYHKDGKQLDHIYRYSSIIHDDDIYFVGDSKYYKPGNAIGAHSLAKQYTYAKNVIQYNINLFNKNILDKGIRYRDPLTEGYNITPNFFISAFVNDDFNFFADGLEAETSVYPMNYHFCDRIFDRDTLLLQAYNINFLFVLSAYISRNNSLRTGFKNKARMRFRERMIDYFNDKYVFYQVTPHIAIEDFVTKYFRVLNGKMYRPSQMEDSLLLGLKKDDDSDILAQISESISQSQHVILE